MKSLKALIWSCCISVLPSSFFLLTLHARTILPLICSSSPLHVILLLIFPENTYGCNPCPFFSQPSGSHAYLSPPTLCMSCFLICLLVSRSVPPLLQGAVMFFLYQLLTEMLLLFLLLLVMLKSDCLIF